MWTKVQRVGADLLSVSGPELSRLAWQSSWAQAGGTPWETAQASQPLTTPNH